ncbi:SGNH/GDSL hydrolase family protein [Peribacillus sp. B-H-3]|jgi:isoamyl acetate esterase|uniref:SGNH/GDSL hydrolase family protein n=1 Tax=Peribacillus sp. B-H-3 TaxID=3400420 RepID=UPI003B0298DC
MKILCFGDSLTRGVTYLNGRLRILKNNYPKILQELILKNSKDENEDQITVINKGVFNDNSDSLMKRFERDVIGERPDYVIIEIGGNDCDFAWADVAKDPDGEHQAVVPLDRYLGNLKSMVMNIKSEGMTPILSTLPPLDPVRYYKRITENFSSIVSNCICKAGGIEHQHSIYNRALKKIAEELDVFMIDVRSAIKYAGDLKDLISDDGIHLTQKGYEIFAEEVYQRLFGRLETDSKTII